MTGYRAGQEALDVARAMAAAGIPVFVAYPDPGKPGDYKPPGRWQQTTANPAYVGAWKPGLALCAVMGHGLDLIDIDPRNGGDGKALNEILPEVYGTAATPSGGTHLLVRSMGVGSRDGVLPGIDIKAGTDGGADHGFAFIAPTVRKSKTTGELVAYEWIRPPDLTLLDREDKSGEKLAGLVRAARGKTSGAAGQPSAGLGERKHAGPVPYGQHHAAIVSYAGWLRSKGYPLREAEACMLMRRRDLQQPPGADRPLYTEAEVLAELHDVYGRFAPGDPPAESSASETRTGRQVVVTLASSIRPRPVRWLWPDRIPTGALTLLAGREGIGKSLVGVHLAARLTRGTLPGGRHGAPSRVMFATSEDAWEFTMVPRLLAAGADLSMIGRVQVDDDGLTVGLTLPVDADSLGAYMAEKNVAMLVLDPLTSVMDGRIDAHRDREVRTALEPLGQLAEHAGAAVLGLVHLGKSLGTDPVNLILGSRAFSAVARVALVAARDPDDEKSNVLSVEKSNLGRIDVPGLTYRIDGAEIATDEGMAGAGLLVWTGETDRRVRDIMAADEDEASERDEAADWLAGYLTREGGEARSGDIKKAARGDGIAERTLHRARRRVGVSIERRGFGQGSAWVLDPSFVPHSRHSRQDSDPGTDGMDGGTNDSGHPDTPDTPLWPEGSIGEAAQ